ncbi:MAG: peptide alpha-N-acetyltransferase Nat2 [Lasallia pustulata]|uniref:Peptide alpha-N-acetyltransferase Nat2 n=1 Tax=Lasallia pustulata TaxID=136370 RepID=A0A5M8PFU5_9LECA|nr:MAG: peptide alpha-N-acetyltransferase Nat2 [Lasallia pustulata]
MPSGPNVIRPSATPKPETAATVPISNPKIPHLNKALPHPTNTLHPPPIPALLHRHETHPPPPPAPPPPHPPTHHPPPAPPSAPPPPSRTPAPPGRHSCASSTAAPSPPPKNPPLHLFGLPPPPAPSPSPRASANSPRVRLVGARRVPAAVGGGLPVLLRGGADAGDGADRAVGGDGGGGGEGGGGRVVPGAEGPGGESDGRGYAHRVEEAEIRNLGEEASIWTQLALAYAIHKSFIFIRVPLTAAVTPKVVRVLRGLGWDIGKRKGKVGAGAAKGGEGG